MINQVLEALQIDDNLARLKVIRQLRKKGSKEVLQCLFQLIENEDGKIASRASHGLIPFGKFSQTQLKLLSTHMQTHSVDWVRLSCAILLMSKKGSFVDAAYIKVLADPFEKVASVACIEVGARKSEVGTEALYNFLQRSEWRLRLEACKALVKQCTADNRVIETLVAMKEEPEARIYDEENEEFQKLNDDLNATLANESEKGEIWGNLDSILKQAEDVAVKNKSKS
jgi:HEAT repeat protein